MKTKRTIKIFFGMLEYLYAKFRSIWRAGRRGHYTTRVELTSYGHLTAWMEMHTKKHTYTEPFGIVEQLPALPTKHH